MTGITAEICLISYCDGQEGKGMIVSRLKEETGGEGSDLHDAAKHVSRGSSLALNPTLHQPYVRVPHARVEAKEK